MRSSASSLSQFLSITSVALALLGVACSDDGGDCGTGGAPGSITATFGDQTLTYETLTSLAGNDCPEQGAPSGVVSVTVEGFVAAGRESGLITFCIPRPDELNGSRTLGYNAPSQVHLPDLTARLTIGGSSCDFVLDTSMPPTGTVVGSGVCDNAENESGFALDVSGSGMLKPAATSTCTANVPFTLQGRVAVTKRMQ
ncbi:hypothetical protein BH11MYX2_BH11MYX2_36340 [soil metagenome]